MTLVACAETGGTHTRAALVDIVVPEPDADGFLRPLTATVMATGLGPGGNPSVVGHAAAARAWTTALKAMMAKAPDGEPVAAACLATSGSGDVARSTASGLLHVAPVVVDDTTSAVWSASPTGTGTVLIAGTGSVAARFEDGVQVAVHGGWGWWLGDEGAGTWMGRQVLRAALTGLQTGTEAALVAGVGDVLGADVKGAVSVESLLAYAYRDLGQVPGRTSVLAPLVSEIDSPATRDIRARAAERLAFLARPLLDAGHSHLITCGAVAASSIGDAAAGLLAAQLPQLRRTRLRHGLLGALVIAAREAGVVSSPSEVAALQDAEAGLSKL